MPCNFIRLDRAGRRSKHVEVESPTETITAGVTVITFARFKRAWVAIEPLRGREYWEADRQDSTVTHKVTGLWNDFDNVEADMRLKFGDRYFSLLEKPRNLFEQNVVAEFLVEEVEV